MDTPAQEPALKPEELLPCPWCGKRPFADIQDKNGGREWFAWCETCDADGPSARSQGDAAKAWNTRPVPPAAAPVGEINPKVLADLAFECKAARQDRADDIAREAEADTGERVEDWPLALEVDVWLVERLLALAHAPVGERSCTCHPDDAATPCAQRFAASECKPLAAAPVADDREAAGVEREKLYEILNRHLDGPAPGGWAEYVSGTVDAVIAAGWTPPSGGGDHDGDLMFLEVNWVEGGTPDARATAAPASGVEKNACEADEREWALDGYVLTRGGWPVFKLTGHGDGSMPTLAGWEKDEARKYILAAVQERAARLAASPKVQGSDVGLRVTDEIVSEALYAFDPSGAHSLSEFNRMRDALNTFLAASRTGQKGAGS